VAVSSNLHLALRPGAAEVCGDALAAVLDFCVDRWSDDAGHGGISFSLVVEDSF
jgi:hypothetical protein